MLFEAEFTKSQKGRIHVWLKITVEEGDKFSNRLFPDDEGDSYSSAITQLFDTAEEAQEYADQWLTACKALLKEWRDKKVPKNFQKRL